MKKEIQAIKNIIDNKDLIKNVDVVKDYGLDYFFNFGNVTCSIFKGDFGNYSFSTYNTHEPISRIIDSRDYDSFGLQYFSQDKYDAEERKYFVQLFNIVDDIYISKDGVIDKILNVKKSS